MPIVEVFDDQDTHFVDGFGFEEEKKRNRDSFHDLQRSPEAPKKKSKWSMSTDV